MWEALGSAVGSIKDRYYTLHTCQDLSSRNYFLILLPGKYFRKGSVLESWNSRHRDQNKLFPDVWLILVLLLGICWEKKPCLKFTAALWPGEVFLGLCRGCVAPLSRKERERSPSTAVLGWACEAVQQSLTVAGKGGNGNKTCCSFFRRRITTSLFQVGTCSYGSVSSTQTALSHLWTTFRKLWKGRNSQRLKATDKDSMSF